MIYVKFYQFDQIPPVHHRPLTETLRPPTPQHNGRHNNNSSNDRKHPTTTCSCRHQTNQRINKRPVAAVPKDGVRDFVCSLLLIILLLAVVNIDRIFVILNSQWLGTKPMKKDDFSDILNAQGFTSSSATGKGGSNSGASLKELKNEAEYVEMDPIKRAVSCRAFLYFVNTRLHLEWHDFEILRHYLQSTVPKYKFQIFFQKF